jgi:hypothetical protein
MSMVALPTMPVSGRSGRFAMASTIIDEKQRTTALAFWRYAHDYLRVARALAEQHKLRRSESQAVYHVVAQGIEFALKSFLRAKGVSPPRLHADVGHSLLRALERGCALGLAPLPPASRASIEALAPHHAEREFRHVDGEPDAFADVDAFVSAGLVILDRIVPDVVADYCAHYAAPSSPPAAEFVQRLRADLLATADGIALPA